MRKASTWLGSADAFRLNATVPYELAVEVPAGQRLTVAFDDLALAI
jgi:hypothetical protein